MTDIRDLTDPSWHPINYKKLELRTLALARQRQLVTRWRLFLGTDPATLTPDELEQAEADTNSPKWDADPVAALAPHVCEGFREISAALAKAYRADLGDPTRAEWNAVWAHVPPLFKAGCAFGEAVERMREAQDEDSETGMVDALNEARGAYFVIATLAEDV